MHLIDTNVVSIFRRLDKAPQQILDWASVDAEDFYLSVITILEIEQRHFAKEAHRQGASGPLSGLAK